LFISVFLAFARFFFSHSFRKFGTKLVIETEGEKNASDKAKQLLAAGKKQEFLKKGIVILYTLAQLGII